MAKGSGYAYRLGKRDVKNNLQGIYRDTIEVIDNREEDEFTAVLDTPTDAEGHRPDNSCSHGEVSPCGRIVKMSNKMYNDQPSSSEGRERSKEKYNMRQREGS